MVLENTLSKKVLIKERLLNEN